MENTSNRTIDPRQRSVPLARAFFVVVHHLHVKRAFFSFLWSTNLRDCSHHHVLCPAACMHAMDAACLCPLRATIGATACLDGIARLCLSWPHLRIFPLKKKKRTTHPRLYPVSFSSPALIKTEHKPTVGTIQKIGSWVNSISHPSWLLQELIMVNQM
jgi:hypothetical protein